MSWLTDPGSAADSADVELNLGGRRSAWLRTDFFDSYVRWRKACEEVRLAYERWRTPESRDSGLTFAAYRAALDREEHAARVHADCARRAELFE
jgi:hypothetical protein